MKDEIHGLIYIHIYCFRLFLSVLLGYDKAATKKTPLIFGLDLICKQSTCRVYFIVCFYFLLLRVSKT